MPGEVNIQDRSIFGDYSVGYGDHNVHEVFPNGTTDLITHIASHYGQRCGHLPDTEQVGVLVSDISAPLTRQMDYYGNLIGRKIQIETRSGLNGHHRGALVVPYINTSVTERRLRAHGLNVWGLPSVLVDPLKDKASSHQLIKELNVPGFQVPDFKVVGVGSLPQEVVKLVEEYATTYQKTGMSVYPLGVMLRAAQSDGNYGACSLKETSQGIRLAPNGEVDHCEYFRDWSAALMSAQDYLNKTSNSSGDTKTPIVATRLMQLADSPGMSALIMEGSIVNFGWNGQIHGDSESSACVGTSKYESPNQSLQRIQSECERSTTISFEAFIRRACMFYGVDINTIRGFVNVDYMIPGPLEVEYQKRVRKNPKIWIGDLITVAEINPRFTNYTDALCLMTAVHGQKRTIRNIQNTARQGVLTIDKYPLAPGVELSQATDAIADLDRKLEPFGTRVIVRMRDNPLGLVLSGDTRLAKQQLDHLGYTI